MIGITITSEELAGAPIEVRRWIEHQLSSALGSIARTDADGARVASGGLAPCGIDEARAILDLIKTDFLTTQVFFELGRDDATSRSVPPFYAFELGAMLQHTRLAGGEPLLRAIESINRVFQQLRNAPDATLFGFDKQGHVYVHAATHASIHRLWQETIARPDAAAAATCGIAEPASRGFEIEPAPMPMSATA